MNHSYKATNNDPKTANATPDVWSKPGTSPLTIMCIPKGITVFKLSIAWQGPAGPLLTASFKHVNPITSIIDWKTPSKMSRYLKLVP